MVTTSTNHNLSTGAVVRLHVPKNFGMTQLNNGLFIVTVLSPTTFSLQIKQVPPALNVDSRNFAAFTTPSKPGFTAEVLCVGSGPTPITNVPPQQLNNFCDDTVAEASQNIAIVNQPF